jgi:hypothetical protein
VFSLACSLEWLAVMAPLAAAVVAAVESRWFFVLRQAQVVMPAVAVRAKAAVLVPVVKAASVEMVVSAAAAVVPVRRAASRPVKAATARSVS